MPLEECPVRVVKCSVGRLGRDQLRDDRAIVVRESPAVAGRQRVDDRVGELVPVAGDDASGRQPRIEPVDAGRPGDDRPQMTERLDGLDLHAGPGDDRVDDQRRFAVERRHVVDRAGDRETGHRRPATAAATPPTTTSSASGTLRRIRGQASRTKSVSPLQFRGLPDATNRIRPAIEPAASATTSKSTPAVTTGIPGASRCSSWRSSS